VKTLLKKIIYYFYRIGYYEDLRIKKIEFKKNLNKISIFPESTTINEKTRIYNHRLDKDNTKIKIGENSIILCELLTMPNGGEIIIGENVFIGENSRIWSGNKIIIGNRVLISHNVNIHDNISHSLNHAIRHEEFLYTYKNYVPLPTNDLVAKEIIIEDDAWIGFNATILKGVTIGRGAIIGANTVITHDVPPFAVVVGNPPRIIKYSI
jgi:maltose O-acetyltransferase